MNVETSLERFGLKPPDEALREIRALLAQEADAERNGRPREDDLALLCSVQLFSRGLLEDVLRIWNAKQSGMDLGAVIDVQFLCGAGLEATKRYLAELDSPEAASALAYVTQCEECGDFVDFSPSDHLDGYREYFGLP